jgi:hypothetical protein
MLLLTRAEFENAASVLGIKATLRQWRHRRAIPAAAKLRLVYFFGQPFQLVESLEPQPVTRPAGSTCLADSPRGISLMIDMTSKARLLGGITLAFAPAI